MDGRLSGRVGMTDGFAGHVELCGMTRMRKTMTSPQAQFESDVFDDRDDERRYQEWLDELNLQHEIEDYARTYDATLHKA